MRNPARSPPISTRAFNGPKLFPDDARAAANTEKWVSIVNSMVDPVWVRRYLFGYIFSKAPDGKPDRAMIDAAVLEMRKQAKILDDGLAKSGSFSGNGYSFADINLMPILLLRPEISRRPGNRRRCEKPESVLRKECAADEFQEHDPPAAARQKLQQYFIRSRWTRWR